MLYATVRLQEVLVRAQEWIRIDPNQRYRQVTVRLWGKGVAQRDEVTGAEIAADRRLVVRSGQFILSRIDARNGAFGVVPESLDGAVVSTDFPVFAPNPERLLPQYLAWLSRTRTFIDLCKKASEGTTNRVRLKEDRFLTAEIPLPSVDEQRRIVARVEQISAKIEEAITLRRESSKATEMMLSSAIDSELDRLVSDGHPISSVGDHQLLITSGPRNFASQYSPSGLRFYRAQDISVDDGIVGGGEVWVSVPPNTSTRAFVQEGDLLVVITGATIGRVALVEAHHPPGLVSQHVGIIRVDHECIRPRFLLYAALSSAWAGGQLKAAKYGQGKPGLNLTNLRKLTFPLPPLTVQDKVINQLDRLRSGTRLVRRAQGDAITELDALLPSILDRAFRGGL